MTVVPPGVFSAISPALRAVPRRRRLWAHAGAGRQPPPGTHLTTCPASSTSAHSAGSVPAALASRGPSAGNASPCHA